MAQIQYKDRDIGKPVTFYIWWPYLLCTHIRKNKYNVLIVFILYCKTLLLLLRWDMDKVKDRLGGKGRFKGGLRCK